MIHAYDFYIAWYPGFRQGAGDLLLRLASAGKSRSNVARNLRRCIHKAGATVPVEIVVVPTTIQIRKPKVKVENIFWPTLSMRSWVINLAETYPEIIFGGFRLEQELEWKQLFSWFWAQFRMIDGSHPVYHELSENDRKSSIPIIYDTWRWRPRSSISGFHDWKLSICH